MNKNFISRKQLRKEKRQEKKSLKNESYHNNRQYTKPILINYFYIDLSRTNSPTNHKSNTPLNYLPITLTKQLRTLTKTQNPNNTFPMTKT